MSFHSVSADGKTETFSAPFRYVWPAELDLMARLAGMSLRERWNDWDRSPFTSESRSHISVWEKAAPRPEPVTAQPGTSMIATELPSGSTTVALRPPHRSTATA